MFVEEPIHKNKKEVSMIYGKNIVITGTLSKPRRQIVSEIIKNGGNVSGAVSSKTDYLIIGQRFGDVKVSAAFRLGTFTVTEEEFLEMMNTKNM